MTSEYATFNTTGRGLGDEVIYYRRPMKTRDGDPAENPGWITWADSLSGTKLRDFEVRGFTPLRQYRAINSQERVDGLIRRAQQENWTPRQFRSEMIWGPILRHPDGPAEFPIDQIMTLRWYEQDNCPVRDANPLELFPQLRGHRVKHYRCPQCNRRFSEVDGAGAAQPFANHLRIMHEYDIASILAYGDRIGLNFTAVEYGGEQTEEINFDEPADRPVRRPRQPREPEFEMETA